MTYHAGDSLVHRADARAKILLLFAFSIGIFFVNSWGLMAVFVAVVMASVLIARLPLRAVIVPLVPVIVLAGFAVAFAFAESPGWEAASRGLLVGVRMVVLVAASFVVCLTTTTTALLEAFSCLINPLRVFHVPVDDVSFTLALALRFIPVVAAEFAWVRKAQSARGGDLANLPFKRKLEVWGATFSAVFVGLFRRADALAEAMDSRCYGLGTPENGSRRR